jgi:predicted PurR-regulated permease PerM
MQPERSTTGAGTGSDVPPRPDAGNTERPPLISEGRAFLVVLVAILVVLWLARGVIAPFIIAALLAYAFSPIVWAVEQRTSWPRTAIVALGYVVLLIPLGILGYFLAGKVAAELQALSAAGPDLVASALRQLVGSDTIAIGNETISVGEIAAEIRASLTNLVATPGEAIHLATIAAEVLLQTFLVLIAAFYFLVDGRRFRDWTIELLPVAHRAGTIETLDRIHEVLAKWLRGQLLLIGLVSAVTYLFLGPVLHVPYALAIGVLTGLLEVIPLVGPVIATAIAAIAAFVHGGPGLAVTVVIFYFVLRQVEDQVVAPIVIGRAVHLHPIVTIFAVLVGLSAYGILGGLLGVPVAAAVNVIFRDLYGFRGGATEAPADAASPPDGLAPDASTGESSPP